MKQSRGIRNNNPGNIRWGEDWKGMVLKSQRTDPDFCQFIDAKYGIRAIGRILLTYYRRGGIETVAGVVSRWAPSNENDTAAYTYFVSHQMGVAPTDRLVMTDPAILVGFFKAIIKMENGEQPYPETLLKRAASLALA